LKRILLILKNFHQYRLWKLRVKEKSIIDFKRGCGYYIPVGFIGINPIGRIEKIEMTNGKIGICKLLNYKTFSDPWDMIEESYYQLLGFDNEKLFKDVNFEEYLDSIE